MAYLYIDEDGDEVVKFEKGNWDSFFGYQCPNCGTYIGNPKKAMDHENELPCLHEPEEYKKLFWMG
jgi:hypothetical protein